LFVGDVGQGAREEIDLVTRGGNYGWSYREGMIAGPRSSPPAGVMFDNPIWEADRAVAGSITGGLVYRGTRFADLAGRYIFGDYIQQRVFAMTLPATGPVQVVTLTTENSPVGFGADPRNGDILIASIGTGIIQRLVVDTPSPPTTPPPTTPPTTPTPKPPSGGGGGGAVSMWFLAALGLLGLRRLLGSNRADTA